MHSENWLDIYSRHEEWMELLQHPLEKYLEFKLNDFGFGHLLALITSLALAWLVMWCVRAICVPEPTPDLRALDPDNDQAIKAAYAHLGYIAKLEENLGEPVADTIEGFREQVRRLGLYAGPGLWAKLDPNDMNLMNNILVRKDLAARLAASAGRTPPRSVEELQQMIREQQVQR